MKEIMLLSKIVSNTQLSRKVFLYNHCPGAIYVALAILKGISVYFDTNFPTILFIVDVCKVA